MRPSYRQRQLPQRRPEELLSIAPLVVVIGALVFLGWLAWQLAAK